MIGDSKELKNFRQQEYMRRQKIIEEANKEVNIITRELETEEEWQKRRLRQRLDEAKTRIENNRY